MNFFNLEGVTEASKEGVTEASKEGVTEASKEGDIEAPKEGVTETPKKDPLTPEEEVDEKIRAIVYLCCNLMVINWKSKNFFRKYVLAPFFGILNVVYIPTLYIIVIASNILVSAGFIIWVFIYAIFCGTYIQMSNIGKN
jgi:hypothetical protein